MFRISRSKSLVPLGLAALLTAFAPGCQDDNDGPLFPGVSTELNTELLALRSSIEPYRQIDAAKAAGYTVEVAHPGDGHKCLSHPQLGGMGVHYLKPGLADGVLDPTAPEVLIYEPMDNGNYELVGVEFIVPFAVRDQNQPAPTLFGQELKHNFTFGLWALHVWAEKHNPSGVFADYNPLVSCTH